MALFWDYTGAYSCNGQIARRLCKKVLVSDVDSRCWGLIAAQSREKKAIILLQMQVQEPRSLVI